MYETITICRVRPLTNDHLDTEIDWETYMHSIELYLDGERDYSAIIGPTGPLV